MALARITTLLATPVLALTVVVAPASAASGPAATGADTVSPTASESAAASGRCTRRAGSTPLRWTVRATLRPARPGPYDFSVRVTVRRAVDAGRVWSGGLEMQEVREDAAVGLSETIRGRVGDDGRFVVGVRGRAADRHTFDFGLSSGGVFCEGSLAVGF